MKTKLKKYTHPEAMIRLRRYCTYQERCHQEVMKKLYEWGFGNEDGGRVAVQLMEENFLNEERFAKLFAGSKFRQKGWGLLKIKNALKNKGISDYLIRISLQEIEEEKYLDRLQKILEKRLLKESGNTTKQREIKAYRYALSRGYSSGDIHRTMKIALKKV